MLETPEDVAQSLHLETPPRVQTGIPGLDSILGGGLFKSGIYIVSGRPGVGKTIWGNQFAFGHSERGGRAVYLTLLAETHGRMLSLLQNLSFFRPDLVGKSLMFVNGFSSVESGGLESLLQLIRRCVRDHRADLLVLDGMVTASALARSAIDYKKFIHELQTWVGVIGCTVIFLTSAGSAAIEPEHTMVDGIIELSSMPVGLNIVRHLSVAKFRGSAYATGLHTYIISSDGWRVYPRLEGRTAPDARGGFDGSKVPTGTSGLDSVLGGGLSRGSASLLAGSSGIGKTTLGLQFISAGSREHQRGIYFSFFETPADILAKAERFGIPLHQSVESGNVEVLWQPSFEMILDEVAERTLDSIRRHGAKLLVIDGLVAWKRSASSKRLLGFIPAFIQSLSQLGVTSIFTDECQQRFEGDGFSPNWGANFANIIEMSFREVPGKGSRFLRVWKTRDDEHDGGSHPYAITSKGIAFEQHLRSGIRKVSRKGRSGRAKR